jgi:predicted transcriptional regulator
MTTIAIRKKLHDFIDSLEEKKAIAIYTLFEDEIEHGKRISIEQYNIELEEAEAEFEKGDYITHEEAIKQMKKW